MTSPLPGNTSGTARLILGELAFQVGWQERLLIPAPAAGAPWVYKVDGRFYERVLAVTYTFTSSAVVATRSIVLNLIDNNGVTVCQVPGSFAIAASSTFTDFFMIGAPAFDYAPIVNTYRFIADFLIPPDWSWQAVVTNMDVGDTFTGIVMLVQRFPNDATQITAGE